MSLSPLRPLFRECAHAAREHGYKSDEIRRASALYNEARAEHLAFFKENFREVWDQDTAYADHAPIEIPIIGDRVPPCEAEKLEVYRRVHTDFDGGAMWEVDGRDSGY